MNDLQLLRRALAHGWVLVACSSSPSTPDPLTAEAGIPNDGSTTDTTVSRETSMTSDATSCNPYSTAACSTGQTCCISNASSAFGTCLDLGACTTTTQFECSRAKGCGPDEVCCGTFIDPPNGKPTAKTFCSKSCAAPAHQTCVSSKDCTQGGVCTPLPEGGPSILSVAAEAFLVCLPADGGISP